MKITGKKREQLPSVFLSIYLIYWFPWLWKLGRPVQKSVEWGRSLNSSEVIDHSFSLFLENSVPCKGLSVNGNRVCQIIFGYSFLIKAK